MQKDLRSYILNRVQAPLTTVEQFNWDNLRAPSISELFSPHDLQELHYLATSVKMSAKTKEKIEKIDKIMWSRGFVRFISGTNRLTYKFIEDTSFLAKVAYNNIGTQDAPMEFKNQMVLKPFVPKIFECTPDGVLCIQERVEPITNREEFMSVAEDVYTLITEWMLGEYVLDDIGTNFFMNYGIRKGFGIVILDFPYMFKVDYGKLICAAKDSTTLSGTCEGEIDYDDGFNELRCTKCGALYTARDLGKNVNEEKVLIRPTQGGLEMFGQIINLNLSGGSKNVDKHEVIGDSPFVGFAPNKQITPMIESPFKPFNFTTPKEEVEETEIDEVKNVPVGVNGVVVEDRPEAVREVDEKKPEVAEEKENIEVTEETDLGEPDNTEDITFEDDSQETEEEVEENETEEVSEHPALENPLIIHDDDEEFKEKAKEESLDRVMSDDAIKNLFGADVMNKIESVIDTISKMNKEEFTEVIKYIFTRITVEAIPESTDISMQDNEEEGEGLLIKIPTEIKIDDSEESIKDINNEDLTVFVPTNILVHLVNSTDFAQMSGEDDQYTGFADYAAKEINRKDINLNMQNEQVYALISENGNYLTDKFGRIICVVKVDNKYVTHVTLISKNKAVMEGFTKSTNELKPGATAQ